MFLLYIVISFVTIPTVNSEGGAICDCQDVGIFKDIVQQVLIEQRMESARITRLERRLKAYERTGPIPNDRLEKLELNVKDISMKFNETVTEANNKHKGFNRGIGAIVQKALISEKIERTKLVSKMNELVNEQKNTIETFKEAINNTIDKRFQDITGEQVVYKDSIETFKVAINKTIDKGFQDITAKQVDYKAAIETYREAINNTIEKRFQDITAEIVEYKDSIETFKFAINKTINKGFQDITAKQVDYKATIETYKEVINNTIDKSFQDIAAEQMEYKDILETFKVAINNTMDKHFQDFSAEQVVYKDTIETYKVAINNTIDERFEYINAKLMTNVNGNHNSIKELNNDIQRISSDIVSVNKSVGQNRNIVDTLSNQVKENKEWKQWSSWGECSELCGDGLRERVRTCASPFGCIGNSKDFKICHIETCKVRLVGGSNQYEGRLEVWHNETWGTVCHDYFNELSASVVCKMLNYPHTDPLVFGSAHFGQGTLPIHLDNVQCTGTEISLPQCKHNGFGSHNCHHGDDVGISCTPVRLVNGSNQYEGRLEVWHDDSWGTVCDDEFTAVSATVVCKMLYYPYSNPLVFKSPYFGTGKWPIHLDDVACTGAERSLFHCPHRSWGSHDCAHNEDVGISCTQVRLVNGSNQYEGRLEVWHNDSWGTVCDDDFTVLSASVVCDILSYPYTSPLVFGSAHFGAGTLPIHLDNVQCTGTEISLQQCQHNGFGIHNCGHSEDVGISCTPVRLVNGSNQYEGRLEVWHDAIWGTVCDDYFDVLSAKVVCKMLKYPHADPTVFGAAHFGPGKLPIGLDDVQCTGSETSVFQCPHYGWLNDNCSNNEDVGILCK